MGSGNTPVLQAFSARTCSSSTRDSVEREAWGGGEGPRVAARTVPGTRLCARLSKQMGQDNGDLGRWPQWRGMGQLEGWTQNGTEALFGTVFEHLVGMCQMCQSIWKELMIVYKKLSKWKNEAIIPRITKKIV